MNEKHNLKQVLNQNLSSLHFQAHSRQAVMERALRKEEPAMKKKLSASLVFAMVLMLTAVTALAAVTVMRSDPVHKTNLSRKALYEQYGLTPETLGLFQYEGGEENGQYTLTWVCNTYHPTLTGVYTTVVKDGKATAMWSYDDVEKSVYEDGDLSAPVWGHKQLEAAFEDREKAGEYSLALYAQEAAEGAPVSVGTPVSLQQGETFWKEGEVIRAAEPGAKDLPPEQAYAIAMQALTEDFAAMDIPEESLEALGAHNGSFHVRENGQTLWVFWFNITLGGVEYECGVTLDGATGEVLATDVLTGGNG